ncbi:hypothetical protein KFE25_008895 [Diacronema lutheri]|uniref:Uncharacterized protein n=2 Tax=Diacronema lutheri TaxID=2081491 RepID=A0A8J5XTW0_DIALT|nr:hypothetical protein KFE25_008895 [Diacronema lutheri]
MALSRFARSALVLLAMAGRVSAVRCPACAARAPSSSAAATAVGRRAVLSAAVPVALALCAPQRAAHAAAPLLAAPTTLAPPSIVQAAAQAAAPAPSAARELVASAAGGAAQRLAKELLLHPIDTVRCRLELQGARRSLLAPGLFADLYAGVLPSAVVGVPSGALFFAAKDGAKAWLRGALGSAYGGSYSKEVTTVLAVLAAQLPYWALRTPFELLKTRAQLGLTAGGEGAWRSAARVVEAEGVAGLFVGAGSNVAYAAPTDVVKFVAYESIKRQAKRAKGGGSLSTLEASACGALGSAIAQALCTPLDVVRTRVIAAQPTGGVADGAATDAAIELADARNFGKVAARLVREDGAGALFAGLLPRVGRAVASGGIQFGAYEATRRLFGASESE